MNSDPDAVEQGDEAPLQVMEVVVTPLADNYVQEVVGDTTVVRLSIPPVQHP